MKKTIPILEQSDEQILKIVSELRVAYKLKSTLRYATQRDFSVHSESVAEHVFALYFLALYFLPLEDPEQVLNAEKINRIIMFHDFGEIIHGDVPYHVKTEKHEEMERDAAKIVFASLPESLQRIGYDSWLAYEHRKTREAQFVYALDKVEPVFELFDPVNEQSLKRTRFTHKDHIEKKLRSTENFPVMQRFVKVVTDDMLKRGVFWVET